MRRITPLLLIGLAACYTPPQGEPVPGAEGMYGTGWIQEPIEATLFVDPYTAVASFELSEPAHVAVFTWQPGTHFRMVYPSIGYSNRQYYDAGRHHIWTDTRRHFTRSQRMLTHLVGVPPSAGPTYFILVASEEPMDVRPFYGTGMSTWVNRVSWSYNPYTATELLASQIIPQPGSSDWTVAYHVVWAQDAFPGQMRPQYVWIRCPGGVTIAVPAGAQGSAFQCPEVVADETQRDSAEARPLPRAQRPRGLMVAERPDDEEMRGLIRDIRRARGEAADDVDEVAIPGWRQADRARLAQRPEATAERPRLRPVDADARTGARSSPAGSRIQDRDRTRSGARGAEARPASGRPSTSPATRPTERARPAARPSSPARPQAERPTPQRERPAPAPQERPDT